MDLSKADGVILSSHCNCMAGLDESCSHIAATLFFIEAHVRIREAKTCTGEKAYWLLPNALVDMPYSQLKNLTLHHLNRKRKD